jgi:inositol-pentakisphosphate 2-kinase
MALPSPHVVAEVASEFERSDPHLWKFFAQGAVNVMFRYASPERCALSRYLLRVPKLQSKHGSGTVEDSLTEDDQRQFRARFFQMCGSQYMPAHIDVSIGPAYLSGLPDVGCTLNIHGFASLVQDVSAAPNGLTVEIKPKCGIVPCSANLSDDHACKARTCRFCMYQYTKLKQGKISRVSSYCPLQFFRGDDESTILNLEALLECPQNNIKISNSGGVLFGSNATDQSVLAEASASLGVSTQGLVRYIAQSLKLSNVLQDIKRVQQLDSLGIELLWKRYCESRESPEMMEMMNLVDNFMLATCAKDVSIIIALEPSGSSSLPEFSPLPESSCFFRVRIIDVDQRPRAWLKKYFQQDQDIVSEFLKSGCARVCAD